MIKPYYSEQGITIYHADCRDVLPQLEPVDLVLTDPPYGVNFKTKTSDYRQSASFDNGESLRASVLYDDAPEQIRALIAEVMPEVLRISSRAMVFCGTRMMWAYPEPRAVGCVFNMSGAGKSSWGFQCMFPILYYGKDPYLQDGKGGRPNSLRDEQPNLERIDHPCPKPLKWMRWAVARASRQGETILDPFGGSGTTAVAAKALGRKCILIERELKYCEIAARRLQQEVFDFEGAPV